MPNEVTMCLVVFALMVVDIVTGFANAVRRGEVSSSVMREGLFHKLGSIVVVLLGVAIAYYGAYIGIDPTITACAGTGVCAMVGIMELVSILENCSRLNPELPMARIFAVMGVDEFKREED